MLTPFAVDEEEGILPVALERAADAIEASLREGVSAAMGRFNART